MRPPASASPEQDREDAAAQREWWRNLVAVLRSPRAVFVQIRDDSDEAAGARQEPILAVILLSGMAAVLSFSGATGTLLDDRARDGIVVAVVIFLAGALYGVAGYWLGSLALHMGVQGAKGDGTYRRDRHLLAYALTPLALSLFVVWPIRLIAFQGASFRSGGSDDGAADRVFTTISLLFLVWSVVLLFIGVRTVHRFTLIRSLGAMLLATMALGALGLVALLLGAGI